MLVLLCLSMLSRLPRQRKLQLAVKSKELSSDVIMSCCCRCPLILDGVQASDYCNSSNAEIMYQVM